MNRLAANYGRPHAAAMKRPAEAKTVDTEANKRPRAAAAAAASAGSNAAAGVANPLLVERAALAGGAGFGSYVNKMMGQGVADALATRQLKEQLKEQLEAEARRADAPAAAGADAMSEDEGHGDEARAEAAAGGAPAAAAAVTAAAATSLIKTFAESAVQVEPTPTAAIAVQADAPPTPTAAVEMQTDATPEPELPAPAECADSVAQTEQPATQLEIGCQCDPAPEPEAGTEAAAAAPEEDDMATGDDIAEPQPATASDPFVFPADDDAAASSSGTVDAEAQKQEEMARRKAELLAESTAAAAEEASEAVLKLEKATGQIVNLEFANDLLMQQVGEAKNQLRAVATKEQAARVALGNMKEGHAKEVARCVFISRFFNRKSRFFD